MAEVDEHGAIEGKGEDDIGGERPPGFGTEGEPIGEAVSTQSKQQCIAACKGGSEAIETFCRSLPDPRLRAGCWGLVFAGETACVGWCLWHF